MSTARAAAVSLLILGAMLLAGCSGAEARRESYVKRGQEYYAKGDYTRASIEFRNAMQVAPKDPQARLLAGEAAEALGRYRDAAALFQSVVESNPDNVQARVDLGQIFEFGHVPQRALKLIAPALAKHPNDAQLLTVRGLARSQLNDYAGALADAQHAVQADPTYVQAVGLLAGLYREKNENAQAVSLVQATLQKLPTSTQLREVLAELYVEGGDDAAAEEQFQKLIAQEPENLHYRSLLAQIDVQQNQLDKAEAVLRSAVGAFPQSDDAKLLLVSFLEQHRSPGQGDTALQSLIAADPGDARLRLALGAIFEQRGQTDPALDAYGEVIRRDEDGGEGPNALIARDRRAAIYMSQGHGDQAFAEVAKVLSRDAGNDDALMIRGNLEFADGHPTAAITDFRTVLRDEPGRVAVHQVLARALLSEGDTALAEDQLQTAIQIVPDDADTRLELGQIYLQTGDADRAISTLEQSVQQLPSNGPLRDALLRAYIGKGDFGSATAMADNMTAALPRSGAGPYFEGLIALAQKKYGPAEADFEQSLQRQPRALGPLLDLVHLQLSRHEESQAEQQLQRMVRSDPGNGLALELLGEVDLAQKAYPPAIAQFSQTIQVAPSLWFAYRNLAVAKADSGDTAGAIAAYRAGIKAAPNEPQLVTELASYYVRQDRPDDAIALFEALHLREPQSLTVSSDLALLLATYRTDQQSLDRARQMSARFATSNDTALLDSSGWVLLRSGDLQHALPVLQRAESRDPKSDLIRYHVAMAELQAGQRSRAQADLKAALAGSQAFPGVADAREKLASLQSGAG